MAGENCLICASDEGVFLDIEEQPTLNAKARNCRLETVSKDSLSTKICHKCAFEIEQCNSFIEKIKAAHEIQKPKPACCILCLDPYNKKIFFDLSKQKNGVNDFVQRLKVLFAEELKKKNIQKEFICLACRYCVDLLTDLRNLSDNVHGKLQSKIKNGIKPADLSKTRTSVVNRKTTYIQSPSLDLNTPSDTDSDASSIMGSRKKVSKANNKSSVIKLQRKCEQCKKPVKNGLDMYKIHRTGATICQKCWLNTDPGKTTSKKRKKIVYPKTKLCSVLLKNIYQIKTNDENEFKISTDEKGNTVFIVVGSANENQIRSEAIKAKSDVTEIEKNETVESEPDNTEAKETKSSRGRKKKEEPEKIEHDIVETKSTRSRQRKESEQSSQEEDEIKSTRSSRRRKESEQSIIEEVEIKSTRGNRTRKESEQSVKENVESKSTKKVKSRRESEQSIQETEVQSSRPTRSRRGSEQSIQEVEIKPTRASRRKKELEQTIHVEVEKSTRNNRNRKNSEVSEEECVEIKSARGTRRRKESEQSLQEIEVNVDVDSDSEPLTKKAKRSSAKTPSKPKQALNTKVSNQSSASETSSKRKRGRSSSADSTGSVRKSTRNTKKSNVQELDEIIEIDDDFDSSKVKPTRNLSIAEDESPISKRSRRDSLVQDDNHSDADSIKSDKKTRSKRSSSISSKESISVTKFKTPPKKSNEEIPNAETIKDSGKDNEAVKTKSFKLSKSEVVNLETIKSSKPLEPDTSESEEIDVLKSTDEETKEDTLEDALEAEVEENLVSKSITPEETISNHEADDESKLDINEDKEEVDQDITTTVEKDSLEIEEDSHVENEVGKQSEAEKSKKSEVEVSEKIETEVSKESEAEKSLESIDDENSKMEQDESSKSIENDISNTVEEESIEKLQDKSNEENVEGKGENKKEAVTETGKDNLNDIVIADIDDSNEKKEEDKQESETEKQLASSSSSKSRKSKSTGKRKSTKGGNKKLANDIIIYDSSDSEITNSTEERVEVTYACRICDKVYENKLIGLQHELTHSKTLKIELQKIENLETIKTLKTEDEENPDEGTLDFNENANEIEEKRDVENEDEEIEKNTESRRSVSEEKEEEIDAAEKETSINDSKMETCDANTDIDIDEPENEESCNRSKKIEETIEEKETENVEMADDDSTKEKSESADSDEHTEIKNKAETTNKRSSRRSSRKIEENKGRKSRIQRKTTNGNIEREEENTALVESASDKIAEAVQETLNDMAELHNKIQESVSVEDEVPDVNEITKSNEDLEKTNEKEQENQSENENENETKMENEPITVEPTVDDVNDAEITQQSADKDDDVTESDNVQSETLKVNEEIVECETVETEAEIECEDITPVVNLDDDSSKEVLDTDSKSAKQTLESEVEITEIEDDEGTAIEPVEVTVCEQVDLTENDVVELPKPDDDIEIEEIVEPKRNINEDENTVDSGTEINVVTGEGPSVENTDGNPGRPENELINNEDEDNNTEDEALAQESLEELLQRKGLQIIDEFAESVTDGDEESEKEINVSSEKENKGDKDVDAEIEIKISDAECTEILEISRRSIDKQKGIESGVVGESQITQDVDVVEEVIHDDDQPHNNVVQEVEVETNGNCLEVANNVVGEVLTDVFNMATADVQKRLDLQTEPISDDETDLLPETLENISREIRNSQDMPSLDPIDDE